MLEKEQVAGMMGQYMNWLKDGINIEPLKDGWYVIGTPFLDESYDGLCVYVKEDNGKIILSDDGYILNGMHALWEESTDLDKKRHQQAEAAIRSHQVNIVDGEMRNETDAEHFPSTLHFFLRAMMEACDILCVG